MPDITMFQFLTKEEKDANPCTRERKCPACGWQGVRDLEAKQTEVGDVECLLAKCRSCGYVEIWKPLSN